MSSVRSLGLHESSAVPFLIAEGLLPSEPGDDLYSWTTSVNTGPSGPVEEELVWTTSCVVWSRAGVIKKVFRLDLEKEDIKHALLTSFSVGKVERSSGKPSSITTSKARSPSGSVTETHALESEELSLDGRGPSEGSQRALVVVLKSQAHIFFLEGNSHVVPLPFEVDSVFATPRGLLFQRKVADERNTSIQPMAPPNSFMSTSKDLRGSQSAKTNRPSLNIIPAPSPSLKSKTNKRADLPRVFSLMDPHSEMGLVVTNQGSRWLQTSLSNKSSGFDILDPADVILYVSPRDELSGTYRANPKCPLILVLTVNMTTGLYTLWTARYREDETLHPSKKKRRRETGGTRSKRRSSHFGMTTGTTTPGARPSAARESFGPRGENWNASVMSHSQYSTEENPEDDDFASQLGQDFGDIGVPSKTSRRVSSMLARTDLAASQDRITFSDLATGSQSSAVHPGGLRQSLGAGSARGSFGFNPRSSLGPGAASIYSATSSFVDAPVDRLLEELNNDALFEGIESMDLKESASGLPEELLLTKVETFSSRFSGNFLSTSKLPLSKKLKVATLCPADYASAQIGDSTSMAIYVVDQEAQSMSVVHVRADSVRIPTKDRVFSKRSKHKTTTDERTLLVQAPSIQHFPSVIDVCKVVDGGLARILTLSATDTGNRILQLQSPWNESLAIDLPQNLMLHENDALLSIMTASLPREGGMKRVISDSSITMVGFDHPAAGGKFDMVDSANRRHKIQVRLEPTNDLVRKALNVCRFALSGYFPDRVADGLLMGWWKTVQWLQERESGEINLEWTALVISLFAQAVPFIEANQAGNTARQSRRKRGLLRSSSGSYVDTESWESMLDQESGSAGVVPPWMNTASWAWIVEQDAEDEWTASRGRRPAKADQPSSNRSTCRQNTYLTRCAALTREFLQTPRGKAAVGADGPLRKALVKIEHSTHTPLCTVLVALHLLREEQKLSACDGEQSHKSLGLLAPVLAQLGGWLGWRSWGWTEDSYYGTEIASIHRWQFENTQMTGPEIPTEPLTPPSIFTFLDNAWSGQSHSFWSLLNLVNSENSLKKGRLWQWCYSLTPRTLSLNGFVSEIHSKPDAYDRIELLHRWGLTPSIIETLPEGVSTPLYEAILDSQTEASTSWPQRLLTLVDRDDLSTSMTGSNTSRPLPPSLPFLTHDSFRDFHHIGVSTLEVDSINAFEISAEADRFFTTKMIFRDDKRFVEVARMLNQSKPPAAECAPEPDWTDSDLLEAQKELVQLVTLRTLSIPAGRAMLAFSARLPLLTEKLPIPSFSLQCVMKPSNVTVSADRASFSEEKVCWAFFHNGVSTGLAISRASKGIDTSWILFNKPQDLTNRHAGFLLALGLNGHLKLLAKWVAFKYLTPKHNMTSIGLLLGLSASYLGTMDTLITRLLSVHVTRMLPLGAAELNLSPLTQTAGIMGIGLLYCNSQHRRMSEVMLSEIENADMEEGSTAHEGLRDEGYRLAAGFALGFINLGKGKDLKGMRDMHIVERLLAVAVGTKSVDIAHVLDRATAGATIALAVIFMKTNDEALAENIDIPDTTVGFDYVRPDLFLLRTLARHVIMWDHIQPCDEWFIKNLPDVYRRRYRLTGVRRLKSNDMPFFNIIAGLCFALGLRFSGSASPEAHDILLSYLDQFIRICRLPAATYDAKLARNSVRHCQDVAALSLAAVMAGTGDLALLRRLRSLHGRVDPDTPYGSHMAAHMAIGLLFLGGGSYTIGTSNLAVASLMCSLYPTFPATVLDNKCHLQAFRHMWVLAVEPRCLIPRDLDSRRPVSIPITIRSSDRFFNKTNAPCLLPNLDTVTRVEIRSPDYWPLVLDFASNPEIREKFRQGDQSIYLRRRSNYSRTDTSFFSSTLAGLSSMQDILPSALPTIPILGKGLPPSALADVNALLAHETHRFTPRHATQSIWDWVFQLSSLHGLVDAREKELVLPSSFPSCPKPSSTPRDAPWLRQSAVDSKLLTETTVQDLMQATKGRGASPEEVRDRLWQLKLLFSWIDARRVPSDEDGGNPYDWGFSPDHGLWLKREYVEELRWKIWGVKHSGQGRSGQH